MDPGHIMVSDHGSLRQPENAVLPVVGFVLPVPGVVSCIALQGVIAEVEDAARTKDPGYFLYHLPLACVCGDAGQHGQEGACGKRAMGKGQDLGVVMAQVKGRVGGNAPSDHLS